MQPAKLDLEIYRGSTYNKPLQWKIGDPLLPVDITGCQIKMEIKEGKDSTTTLDTLTTANGRITIEDTVNSNFTLHFPSATTKNIATNLAVYDLDIVYPGGEPTYTIVEGLVKYSGEVTKI